MNRLESVQNRSHMGSSCRLPPQRTTMDLHTRRFIDRARQAPRLTAEEELDDIRAWRESKDRAAAGRLCAANARHVVFTALKFRACGILVADLISYGNIGLMKALDRFDEAKLVRFSTYAAYWIRAEIILGIMDSWSLLSGPRGALDS